MPLPKTRFECPGHGLWTEESVGQVLQGLLDALITQSTGPVSGGDYEAALVAYGFASALRAVAASFGVELLVDNQHLDPSRVLGTIGYDSQAKDWSITAVRLEDHHRQLNKCRRLQGGTT